MKTNIVHIIFIAGIVGFTVMLPTSFADDATVSIPSGTSVPGCESVDECFTPPNVKVNIGDTVTWNNNDTAAHTVTKTTDENDYLFDSGLFAAGTTFSHTFEDPGIYDYYCIVHPWMEGTVMVQSETNSDGTTASKINDVGNDAVKGLADAVNVTEKGIGNAINTTKDTLSDIEKGVEDLVDPVTDNMIKMQGMTADGTIMVTVYSDEPTKDESLYIVTEFQNRNDESVNDVVYDIKVMQNGNQIFTEDAVQTDRYGQHTTESLLTDQPVDIDIKIINAGIDSFGSNGEVISFHVIPEFGTIVMMVLAVAIVSIIVITAKTNRLTIPKI